MGVDGNRRIVIVDPQRERMVDLATELGSFGYATARCRPDDWEGYTTAGAVVGMIVGPSMPCEDVSALIAEMREYVEVPVIALVDHDDPDRSALLLEAGADCCVHGRAAFSTHFIVSALRAVERRERIARRSSEVIRAGQMSIFVHRHRVEIGGRPIPLTATEFSLLALLAERPGRVISAGEILHQIRGDVGDPREAQDTVKVHISRLRQKLGLEARCVVNVYGQGYMFDRRRAPRETLKRAPEEAATPVRPSQLKRGA
jgi:DNA-binding response OmpR family regulator